MTASPNSDRKWKKLTDLTQVINSLEENGHFLAAFEQVAKMQGYLEFLIDDNNLHPDDMNYVKNKLVSVQIKANYLKDVAKNVSIYLCNSFQFNSVPS